MVWEKLLELMNQTKSQPRFRLGRIVGVDPLTLSVDGLPVDSEHLLQPMDLTRLAKVLGADGYQPYRVGDIVALLPDEEEQNFVLLGVVEENT